mmetsp:Transcript_34516/g.99091  ORF Transcript_34516/g.99091 Transcript_34516/m.99091 type:complete len:207 (+) Transcript_34516:804-1424(+)
MEPREANAAARRIRRRQAAVDADVGSPERKVSFQGDAGPHEGHPRRELEQYGSESHTVLRQGQPRGLLVQHRAGHGRLLRDPHTAHELRGQVGPAQALADRHGLPERLRGPALRADAAELVSQILPVLVQQALRCRLRIRWQDAGVRPEGCCSCCRRCGRFIVLPLPRGAERAGDRLYGRQVRILERRASAAGVLPGEDAAICGPR